MALFLLEICKKWLGRKGGEKLSNVGRQAYGKWDYIRHLLLESLVKNEKNLLISQHCNCTIRGKRDVLKPWAAQDPLLLCPLFIPQCWSLLFSFPWTAAWKMCQKSRMLIMGSFKNFQCKFLCISTLVLITLVLAM